MSAICAVVHWNERPVLPSSVERMLAAVPHRSRDGNFQIGVAGEQSGVAMGLGFTSTSTNERQRPIRRFSNVCIAADAAIYNRAELAAQLGIESTDTCDVIAAGYRRWGEEVFDRLDGDFAIAIWDGNAERLLVARDPFGVRALHYWSDDKRLVVASEAKQIILAGFASATPDLINLGNFIVDQYHDLNRSFFKDISRVPPGHLLVAERQRVRLQRYWTPPLRSDPRVPNVETCAEQFRGLLRSAVAKRAAVTSPLLIELSGGHDSTSIAALASELRDVGTLPTPAISALSYTYAGLAADETEYIKPFIDRYQLDWIEIPWRADSFEQLFEPAMWRTDSPFADLQRPMRAQAERAAHSRGARVLLSGFGGDEVLYDYGALGDLWRSGHFLRLVRESSSWRELAATIAPDPVKRLLRRLRGAPPIAPRPAWLSPYLHHAPVPTRDSFSTTALQNLMWSSVALQGRVSWATGWCASGTDGCDLEPRFPFLDRELFEFLFALPLHQRPSMRAKKQLLRDAMARDLPTAILERQAKTDFSSYYTLVLKRAWPHLRDQMRSRGGYSKALFDRCGIEALVTQWERSPHPPWPLTYTLWRMACAQLWLGSLDRYRTPANDPLELSGAISI